MTFDVVSAPAEVLLADGTVATVRPLEPEDHDALIALHEHVSGESSRLRFLVPTQTAGRTYAEHLLAADTETLVLVAVAHGELLGVGSAEVDPRQPDEAEVAFLVADAAHGHGIGTLLLEHLAAVARRRGIRHFTADVLMENQPMLRVFADAGYPATRRVSAGVVVWEISTDPTETTLLASEQRHQTALAAYEHSHLTDEPGPDRALRGAPSARPEGT